MLAQPLGLLPPRAAQMWGLWRPKALTGLLGRPEVLHCCLLSRLVRFLGWDEELTRFGVKALGQRTWFQEGWKTDTLTCRCACQQPTH